MKKYFKFLLASLGILFNLAVCAQTRVLTITGDTCENNSLNAVITSGAIKELKWYKNEELLMSRGPWARTGVVVAGSTTAGSGPAQLYDPHGVFVDKNKNVYVVDNLRIQKWLPGATTGITVAGGSLKGMGLDRFYAPVDVVVDKTGNIYVSDYLSNSVRKWVPGASSGTIVAGGNGAGTALNQLNGPQGIAMDTLGNLYIVDSWNDRVVKWGPGASAGVVVAGGYGRGTGANQFKVPYGVGVDKAGNVYVSDPGNYRVQKWSPGASTGITVAGGNGNGVNANQLKSPNAIRVSAQGDVYIMDAGRLIKWKAGEAYGMVIAGGYGAPANADEKHKIATSWGIALDNDENAYVSDLTYARVLRFLKRNTADGELANVTTGNYKAIAIVNGNAISSSVFKVNNKPPLPLIQGVGSLEVSTVGKYTVKDPYPGATYNWTVSSGGTILSGQGTPEITIRFSSTSRITVVGSNSCGQSDPKSKSVTTITGSAVISGNNCAGSTLYGGVSVSKAQQYLWFKDSVMVAANGMGEAIGTIIAGGNGSGSAANQLNQPEGIFVRGTKMYIVDNTNYRVQQWTVGSTSAITIAGGNGKGTGLNQFASPKDVVVDGKGNVYVSDALAHRVVKWAPNATQGVVVAGGNGAGAAANQLNGPQSLFIDKAGNLYIADRWNHRVVKWAPGATSGIIVSGGNGSGSAANQLSEPTGVSVDSVGNVFVSDLNNFRVQKWTPGASSGVTVAGGNGNGKMPNQFSFPWKVSVDTAGALYVLDRNRVQKWLPGASYGVTVANGSAVGQDGIVANPSGTSLGLFVDAKATIYVTDLFEARVKRVKTTNVEASSSFVSTDPGKYYLTAITTDNRTFTSQLFEVIGIPPRPQGIVGKALIKKGAKVTFSVKDPVAYAQYNWTVPPDAEIQSGWSTHTITVKWGESNGQVSVFGSNQCGSSPVRVKNISVETEPLIASRSSTPTVTLYPNPTADMASVLFESTTTAPYEITVTNIMGKQLLVKTGQASAGQNKVNLSVSNLNNDIYIVNLKHEGKVSILKLSKQAL